MEDAALSGKTTFVIGASSGIGLATANLFADVGATVHAAARRREALSNEQAVSAWLRELAGRPR